jgi:hypothetical protein
MVGLCLSICSTVNGTETTLPLFILVGQSNMTGADSEVSEGIPGIDPRDQNVLFWNRAAWSGVEWENDNHFQPLRIQKTAGYCGDVIGPEFAFSRAIQSRGGYPRMAILKVSFPGSDLASDWRKEPAMGKQAYSALQEEMTQVMQVLAARRETPEVKAILVHQGISDATTESKAEAYEINLRQFLASLRADFGKPDTPVVLARENASPNMKVQPMEAVRATTVRVAESTPHTAWINVDDLDRVKGHHFTAEAQMEIGKRYAAALIDLSAKPYSTATKP